MGQKWRVINCNRYGTAVNGTSITPVFAPGITHSAIATSPDSIRSRLGPARDLPLPLLFESRRVKTVR
jgi:hypothetical protein